MEKAIQVLNFLPCKLLDVFILGLEEQPTNQGRISDARKVHHSPANYINFIRNDVFWFQLCHNSNCIKKFN